MPGPFAIENPEACGMGRGAECCAYLVMTAGQGFECGRDNGMKGVIDGRFESMHAKRRPTAPRPDCQIHGKEH